MAPTSRASWVVTGLVAALLIFCVVMALTVEPLAWAGAGFTTILLGIWMFFLQGFSL